MPTKTYFIALAVLTVLAISSPAVAEFDASSYHDGKCMACHGTEVYTRENRRITSFPALEGQVARCDANLGTQLFPEDLTLLVEHLNTNFYKFPN
jgi:hypothetical protein